MEHDAHTRWFLKVIGFLVGFVAAIAAEFLLLWLISEIFGHRFYPRGLGWLILPFTAGIGCAALFPSLRKERFGSLLGGSQEMRLYVAGTASWALLVAAYVLMAEPFGSRIRDDEWMTIFKWLFIPPVLALIVCALFRWAKKTEKPTQPSNERDQI